MILTYAEVLLLNIIIWYAKVSFYSNFSDACAIKLDDYVIITGDGTSHFSKVSKYDMNGWVENLPNLIYGRVNHGCGHYYTDANELVCPDWLGKKSKKMHNLTHSGKAKHANMVTF